MNSKKLHEFINLATLINLNLISQQNIQSILDAARIDEVIGEFISLKKRGVNLLGLCPFHTEKTPSFTVSPAKGIYKCFGCGKAGNAVNFIMEHEHYTYPEALRFLAKKYLIEIEEREETPEEKEAHNEKESLFNLNAFAQKFFTENLFKSDQGKAIGLPYFKERGFSRETIEKFGLGYSDDSWNHFTDHAIANGYKAEYLEKLGLTASKDNKRYDLFRGRVMFPIHSLIGRVIGFGGRILSSDKTKPKYVNSPESEIYHKGQVLYGLNFSKTSIVSNDNCLLVEGYTDVISLFQAGIENVVSSSGTSLTVEQIKLIRRYTNNITILYDGDAAGIKASFRGIDLILEEGMNVRIVLFPDGEDPDSFSKTKRPAEVKDFIKNEAKDFIKFKTQLLLKEASDDPLKKASLIKEIIQSVSLIPDGITRSLYVKECSALLRVAEQTLINELNKLLRKNSTKKTQNDYQNNEYEVTEFITEKQLDLLPEDSELQEKEIIRLLLNYGNNQMEVIGVNEENKEETITVSVAEYIVQDLVGDDFIFDYPLFAMIFEEFRTNVENFNSFDNSFFTKHSNPDIRNLSIELLISKDELSKNWENKYGILTKTEKDNLKKTILHGLNSVKDKKIKIKLNFLLKEIETSEKDEDILILLSEYNKYLLLRSKLSIPLGKVIDN